MDDSYSKNDSDVLRKSNIQVIEDDSECWDYSDDDYSSGDSDYGSYTNLIDTSLLKDTVKITDYDCKEFHLGATIPNKECKARDNNIQEMCKLIPILHPRATMLNVADHFSDSDIFFVDGDSLLMCALNDCSLNWNFGGQMLHLIYLIERKLMMFVRKGGKFHVLFFCDAISLLWNGSPSFQLAREVLIFHLRENGAIIVSENVKNPWDPVFKNYIKKYIPTFMLISDSGYTQKNEGYCQVQDDFLRISKCYFEWVRDQILYLQLNVAFVNDVLTGVSTLNAFFIESKLQFCEAYSTKREKILKNYNLLKDKVVSKNTSESHRISNDADGLFDLASQCCMTLLKKNDKETEVKDFVKVFLLYTLVKKDTPLSKRSFPRVTNFEKCNKLKKWIDEMQILFCNGMKSFNIDKLAVPDIWDGNLFATIGKVIADNPSTVSFKSEIMSVYNDTMTRIYDHLEIYENAQPFFSQGSSLAKIFCNLKVNRKTNVVKMPEIVPMNDELLNRYAGNVYNRMVVLSEEDPRVDQWCPSLKKFEDKYHWHCKKLLFTDIFSQSSECLKRKEATIEKNDASTVDEYTARKLKKKAQRKEAQLPTFQRVYGESMEGGTTYHLPIAVLKQEKGKKQKGVGAKAKKIIEDNEEKKRAENEKKDTEMWREALNDIKRYEAKIELNNSMECIERVERRVTFDSVKKKLLLYKLKLFVKMWKNDLYKSTKQKLEVDAVLLVRLLWLDMKVEISIKEKENMTKYLRSLGFVKLADALGGQSTDMNSVVTRCHIEFQFKYMGHLLLRDLRRDPDPRIDPRNYIPDTWQRKLLDAVDANKSALIVAPTSSGKTFSSYYCMEKILRTNNDDVVVYVSPTKALCNQVSATIISRYGEKQMPAGKSVCGVFTRDYRSNVDSCQVLVTVPQCLEILLLSNTGFSWIQRIKYVIFDEIHCIGAEQGAEVWEHLLLLISCPFLALSATIENPHELHGWLQTAQDFQMQNKDVLCSKRSHNSYKVELVIVEGRHSDLEKYVFDPQRECVRDENKVKHCHPCCALSLPVVMKHGIPDHVSLSPKECLELLDAMKQAWPEKEALQTLALEVYFNTFQFLKRQDVKPFENDLKIELTTWAQTSFEKFTIVLRILNGGQMSVQQYGRQFVLASFVTLMNALKSKEMLPAIVFCLDSRGCKDLVRKVVMHCQSEENKYRASLKPERESAFEKRQHKKKKDEKTVEEVRKGTEKRSHNREETNMWLDEQLSGVTFKGIGMLDQEDLSYLYNRISCNGRRRDLLMMGIKYGIGYHFAGMSNKERSTVEILFRKKFLKVIVATSTLALGIHVPCRAVVIGGDSPFLTPILFRQMSGRAGRRGFDDIGHVVFDGVPQQKINRLMSGSLSRLLGNFPINVTLCLRLQILVKEVTSKDVSSECARKDTITRVLCLLQHPLILQHQPDWENQFKYHFLFSAQFLMREGLLDRDGRPQGFAGIAAHLHYHEPGNYAFISCLSSGIFHKFCRIRDSKNRQGKFTELFMRRLVHILSYFFTSTKVHASHIAACERSNSIVLLPPLPIMFQKSIDKYNSRVEHIFDMYLRSVPMYGNEKLGEDNVLPMSKVEFKSVKDYTEPSGDVMETILSGLSHKNVICSSFAGLSGHPDPGLDTLEKLISNIRHQVFTDVKVIPTFESDTQLNSYALDFFKHGIQEALIRENNLHSGEAYDKIKDFALVLLTIATSLELYAPPEDIVAIAFRQLADEYTKRFRHCSW